MTSDSAANDFNPDTAYDNVASLFDTLMRDDAEVAAHTTWLERTLHALGVKLLIDAAAGTGAQTIGLAKTGAFEHIVASDASREMLDVLCTRLERSGLSYRRQWSDDQGFELTVVQSSWEALSARLPRDTWDAVICLGFSIPHLATSERFLAAFQSWRELLRAGGYVLFDFGTNFEHLARAARDGSFRAEPRGWSVEEIRDPAGFDCVIATGRELISDAATPLGWKIRAQKMIARLSDDRSLRDPRAFSYETALLDYESIATLASQAGFQIVELPCGPSPHLHVGVQDILLRKPD